LSVFKKTIFLIFSFIFLKIPLFAEYKTAQNVLKTKILTIQNPDGEKIYVEAEIARTGEEKERGLMFRKKLEDGKGMLFIYDYDLRMSFWMKNTIIPLSIAYITKNGAITGIFDMEPLRLSPVRSTRAVRYALEVPQGWFDRAGVKENAVFLNIEDVLK
jgi:uncharacterized membrane protein (UPF0127 family)